MEDQEAMRLEGVLLTTDAQILCIMNQVLDKFEIETEVCTEVGSALDAVSHRKLDALIVDWNSGDETANVLAAMRKSDENAHSMVLAMVNGAPEMQAATRAGANFIINKPVNFEQAARCVRAAYGTMLQQRRRAARYPVEIQTSANIVGQGNVGGKITDLSVGGLAFECKISLFVDEQLSFEFRLPGSASMIHATGKVVNTDRKSRAGICFTSVQPNDLILLKQWLASRLARLMDRQIFSDYTNRLNGEAA